MGFLDRAKEQLQEDLYAGPAISLDNLGGFPKVKGKTASIRKGKEPNTLKINGTIYKVKSLNWAEQGQRSVGKAAAGAIVGGVLTGGLGIIAGAALGGRKKDHSSAVIGILDGEIEYSLYVRCNEKEFRQLTEKLGGY